MTRWRKSTQSGTQDHPSACVELAHLKAGITGIRDSKDTGRPPLIVPTAAVAALAQGIKAGKYDL